MFERERFGNLDFRDNLLFDVRVSRSVREITSDHQLQATDIHKDLQLSAGQLKLSVGADIGSPVPIRVTGLNKSTEDCFVQADGVSMNGKSNSLWRIPAYNRFILDKIDTGSWTFNIIGSSLGGTGTELVPRDIDWTVIDVDNGGVATTVAVNDIIFDGTQFIAVGGQKVGGTRQAIIWRSLDGLDWSSAELFDPIGSRALGTIVYHGGIYILASNTALSGGDRIYRSVDGLNFTPQAYPEASNDIFSASFHNGSEFLLFSSFEDALFRSSDGVSWTKGPLPVDGLITHIRTEGNPFLSLSFDSRSQLYESMDGVTWNSKGSSPTFNGNYRSLLFDTDRLYYARFNSTSRLVTVFEYDLELNGTGMSYQYDASLGNGLFPVFISAFEQFTDVINGFASFDMQNFVKIGTTPGLDSINEVKFLEDKIFICGDDKIWVGS